MGWLGSGHAFYVLQSRSVLKPSERFDTNNILYVINDSDESEDLDKWRIAQDQGHAMDDMSQSENLPSDSEQSVL